MGCRAEPLFPSQHCDINKLPKEESPTEPTRRFPAGIELRASDRSRSRVAP